MEFQPFHDYNRLARRGIVTPLVCPNDGAELSLQTKVIDGEDEPVLKCFMCNTTTQPGLRLLDSIKAQISEWYGV